MANVLAEIELATLLPNAQLVQGQQNAEETWISQIYAESGPTIAYVKMLNPNQVLSEVVCSLIGLALNLSMPKPFLVYVDRQNLTHSNKWQGHESWRVCFGSEDANCPSFRQILKASPNRNAVLKKLETWSGFKETAWFDEWIANDDRHVGNVLWDGTECWLIDHSHALTGPAWTVNDLQQGKKVVNRFLSDPRIQKMTSTDKDKWKDLAESECLRYQEIMIDNLKECGVTEEYATDEEVNAVIDFLKQRAENFFTLACDRLQIPRLSL